MLSHIVAPIINGITYICTCSCIPKKACVSWQTRFLHMCHQTLYSRPTLDMSSVGLYIYIYIYICTSAEPSNSAGQDSVGKDSTVFWFEPKL